MFSEENRIIFDLDEQLSGAKMIMNQWRCSVI